MFAFWFESRARPILLDSDSAIGDNVGAAKGADASLKTLDEKDEHGNVFKKVVHGLSTDAGSRGTREVLA